MSSQRMPVHDNPRTLRGVMLDMNGQEFDCAISFVDRLSEREHRVYLQDHEGKVLAKLHIREKK